MGDERRSYPEISYTMAEGQNPDTFSAYCSFLTDNVQVPVYGHWSTESHPTGFVNQQSAHASEVPVYGHWSSESHPTGFVNQQSAHASEVGSIMRTNVEYGASQDFFCTQVPKIRGCQEESNVSTHANQLNLSQGLTYSQMMQGSDSFHDFEMGAGSFVDLLNGPMFDEKQMFMIAGRSEYVHNGVEDDVVDEHEDSAYKYNDRWANGAESGQESENSKCTEEVTNDPTLPCEQEEHIDLDNPIGAEEAFEGGAPVHAERDVHHLSQDDIEIFIENESVKAAQTCSQEVRSHHVPHVGQVFDSDKEAFQFYNTYAEICGFSVKKASNYHSRQAGSTGVVTRNTFKCNRAGKVLDEETLEKRKQQRDNKREETRRKKIAEKGEAEPLQQVVRPPKKRKRNKIDITDCRAEMVVTLKNDKWIVTSLQLDHNHELSPHEESRFLRSHKHMTEEEKLFIRTFNSVKLPTRKIMAILSYLRGGCIKAVPYTKKIVSKLRTSMRNESKLNDMMQAVDYFRRKQSEDPRFYYAFKVDKTNTVENIFWCDGTSRRMYEMYGDCISFDTTFKTNRYNMPFAPFVGITGHGDNCLFGCAILQNETVDTFKWLFETFLHCHGWKCPKTIITDQDVAMKQAIPAVFKTAKHQNCLFHICKKAEEKHARSFGKIQNLHNEFKDTIHFSLTLDEFEASWKEMTEKYKVGDLKYLKTMWENRDRFVPVFFKNDFFPFIHSTSRSEGTNAVFKDNVGSTYSVSSFLIEYDKIAENIEENEKNEDSVTRTTTPNYCCGYDMEVQAGKIYNRKIFYRFQKQLKFVSKLHVVEVEKDVKYEVYKSNLAAARDFRSRRYLVLVDLQSSDFTCICSKFNKDGMLCSHVLKVLVHLNIPEIPEKYFIDRWKPRDKKVIRDLLYNVPLDLTSDCSQLRYNVLSKVCLNVASDGSKSNEKYLFVTEEVKKIAEKLDEMTLLEEKTKESPRKDKVDDYVVHPEYGHLNDPVVQKSKGRPSLLGKQKGHGRFKTLAEQVFLKKVNTCSHCGSEEHNIQRCDNLHLDSSLFPKRKKPNKKTGGLKKQKL